MENLTVQQKTEFDFINDVSGFANGEKFTSEEQVRNYFTVDNIKEMFGTCSMTQEELNQMSESVINNRWHFE